MSVRHTPLPQLGEHVVREVSRCVCRQLGVETPAMHEVATLHVHALVAAAEWNSPDLLTEQLGWERERLTTLGVTLRYRELPDAVLAALLPHVDRVSHAKLRVLHSQAERLDRGGSAHPDAGGPRPADHLVPAARRYLEAALSGDSRSAGALVRAALARGATPGDVIRDVLLPAQVEVGRLWGSGAITVSQEHRVTGVTSRCLSLFETTPRRQPHPRVVRRVAAATVGTESHDLGLRMLAHVLSHGGWEVDYLGAGVPIDDLVEHVRCTAPDVLAVSTTMTAHVSAVAQVVLGLRAAGSPTRVLLGGRVFATRPALAQALGADATAPDAETALAACEAWFADDDGSSTDDREPGLGDLAERYRFPPRHVEGALALLAGEFGVPRDDLVRRLAGQRGASVAP